MFWNTLAALLDNPELDYDKEVYRSESETGDRNRALAYMMRASKVIDGAVPEHLEVYFKAWLPFGQLRGNQLSWRSARK